jgi:hypothetical protein
MILDDTALTATTSTTTSANKSSTTGGSAIPKEKKNVVVKRDIVQKKEPLNILFYGHGDAGKEKIQKQLGDVGTDGILFETPTKRIISQGRIGFTHRGEIKLYEKSTPADVVIFVIN